MLEKTTVDHVTLKTTRHFQHVATAFEDQVGSVGDVIDRHASSRD